MPEKETEPSTPSDVELEGLLRSKAKRPPWRRHWESALLLLLLFISAFQAYRWFSKRWHDQLREHSEPSCPQASVLLPEKNGDVWKALRSTYTTENFRSRAIGWLAGAVKIPTESYDQMGPVGSDDRWNIFGDFHDYLLEAFPMIHSTLELTKVNTYGLIYVWQGSDDSLQPVLFAAHQDVVPVDSTTIDQWNYPPYSGYYDGDRIWGRGSADDKPGLIGVMAAIESLLEENFQPSRTFVLAFGFDEEASGLYGAQTLAPQLLEMFGENGLAMIVDEGSGYATQAGTVLATVGVTEKGYMDVRLDVTAPGGHSSLPPPHTSIGILSQLFVTFEQNPFEVHLSRDSVCYQTVQCLAEYAPDLPRSLKKKIIRSRHSNKALRAAEKELFEDLSFKNLVGTTQALDLVQGGVKTNALPEQAWGVVNHRISTLSSVEEVKIRDTELLKSLAVNFNLSYTAFGSRISGDEVPTYGTLTLNTAFADGLEPAPLSSIDKDAVPYKILSGTIKATYNSYRGLEGDDNIIVAPGIMSGNTDTRWYWKLTENIFRYNHQNGGGPGALPRGVHTVNEGMSVDNFIEIINFFTLLILNADDSTSL